MQISFQIWNLLLLFPHQHQLQFLQAMICGETLALHPALFQTRHHSHPTGSSSEQHWQDIKDRIEKMTLRAPICEGSQGSLLSSEPKLLDNLFYSFSIAFWLIYVTPLCCYLYSQESISSLLTIKAGEQWVLSYTWLTMQCSKGQGLCEGKMTPNICRIFLHF